MNDDLKKQLIAIAIQVEMAGMLNAEIELEGFPYLITIKKIGNE